MKMMSLTTLKKIILDTGKQNDLYLSLINESGTIISANTPMRRDFLNAAPAQANTSFFDLIHPSHKNDFIKTIQQAGCSQDPATAELYIKNGYYHPTMWQISRLQQRTGDSHLLFCVGYKVLDAGQFEKFNSLVKTHHPLIIEGVTGILFHDSSGSILAANKQISSILETSLERLYQLGDIRIPWKTYWKINNEEGVALAFEDSPFMKAIKTGIAQTATLMIELKSGETRWLFFHSQPVHDNNPGGCAAISHIIDVTNEKKLAARVQEKKALIDAFVRQTPNLVWVLDEDSRLHMASDAFFSYFGIDKEASLYKEMSKLVPESVYRNFYDKHIHVLETGRPMKFIEKVRFADGAKYISHINIFPVEGTEGRKLVGGYAVNLPDTSRIESELREANERLLTISQATTNAIWEWDMQTGTIFRNEALMEMIGYQPDHSKGLSWWLRRIHPEDRNRVGDKVKEATDNNLQSWQDEYRFKCADGHYKHIRDKGFVIYENGLPVKMIGSLLDISDRKELENKLADEKLERQRELSETVIRVQEKERTRIGHELHDNVNQILSSTLLFVDMLQASGKEQKQLKGKSLEYLRTAIDEIRKLSRELVVPHFKEQGLVDSIRTMVDDIHMTDAIRIQFTHDIESDLLSPGKKITLFRIIQEQLKNILKHSKAKNAAILLQTKANIVELVISDNGVGFDSRQTHQGIGLSNIYERASFYNGTVNVQAAPGKGCVVTVILSVS
ncbi:MAG: PAS domain-containing protein [Chitinophagaceae bacterium]|nr:PAS domain-containing protein [Chitinophagaceae bacterium]